MTSVTDPSRTRRALGVAAVALALTSSAALPLAGSADATPTAPTPAAMSFSSVDYPGATGTTVTGVNVGGEVVGWFSDASGVHGFTRTGGEFSPPIDIAGTETRVRAVNDAGTEVGTYLTDNGGVEHAFVLTSAGTLTVLDDPAILTGGRWDQWGTVATGINSSGVVVGYSFSVDLDGTSYPDGTPTALTTYTGFVWKSGQFTPFNAPGAVTLSSPWYPPNVGTQINGINKSGVMVGSAPYIENDVIQGEAGYVASGTTVTTFRDPNVQDIGWCGYTRPYAINDLGTIVGISGNGCAPYEFAWLRIGSQLSYLSYPGAARTVPASINNDGVVGGSWSDGSTTHGFVVTVETATVSGSVTTTGAFYPGTRLGVRACPAEQAFTATCANGAQAFLDSAGRYTLRLSPATWNVGAFAWQGGDPGQELTSASWNVTLSQGQAVRHDFVLVSQDGSVAGTIRADWLMPPGTTYFAQACPGSPSSFSPGCSGGVTASADALGRYALTLPAGVWSVAGFAQPPDEASLFGSAPQQVGVTSTRSVNASFTVSSPFGAVSGTVKPSSPVPPGASYAGIACQTPPVTTACGVVAQGDSAGRYTLVLPTGTWWVAGAVYPPGGAAPVIGQATEMTVSWHTTSRLGTTPVTTPWGAVVVTVSTAGLFPADAVLGAYACPPGPSCTVPASPSATADSRGRATLVLLPGTWTVWAGAWVPGRPPVVAAGSTVQVSTNASVALAITVPSPYTAITGSVTPMVRFPDGTSFAALACPSSDPTFGPNCPAGVLAPTDGRGGYQLVLTPGQWRVAGVAFLPGGRSPVVTAPVTVDAAAGAVTTAVFRVLAPTSLQVSAPWNAYRQSYVQVGARLLDVAGRPVSGVTVQLSLASAQCTPTTDRNGDASCMLFTGPTTGPATVGATFSGNSVYLGSTGTAPLTIR